MLKLTQEQFDATIRRAIEERDPKAAVEWKALGAESIPLQLFALAAIEKVESAGDDPTSLRYMLGMTIAALHLGYELAKTESANERAEIVQKSEALA